MTHGVTASLNSSCGLSLSYAIPDVGLIQGESLSWYLNTDGNPGTGDPVFEGAEYVVMILGRTGQDDAPRLMAWNGTTFDVAGGKALANAGAFGFTANIADLNGLTSGGALSFVGAAGYRGIYRTSKSLRGPGLARRRHGRAAGHDAPAAPVKMGRCRLTASGR